MLITNGTVISPDKIIDRGAVYIKDGIIEGVGPSAVLEKKYPKEKRLSADGGVVMPGLINAHMHFYSTFARGMVLGGKAPRNFVEILEGLWWRLDKKLGDDDIYYSALVPLIESIKCGTTSVIDHHASPFAVEESLDIIAKAVSQVGVRSALCYEVSDRDGADVAKKGIAENVRFIKKIRDVEMLSGMMGLHASFTLSDKTLDTAVAEALSLDAGCHIHTAEDKADLNDAREKYGMGVVERLHARGVLGKKTICAHCVHISEKEMGLLADTGTSVVHNPESNMNNAVGTAPILELFRKGALVGLGTDGMTVDMFRESKAAMLLQRQVMRDPAVGFNEAFAMQMTANPKIAEKIFGKKVGVIEKGAVADIIILDYRSPTPLYHENLAGHFLFGISAGDVSTVVIGGKVVMKEREFPHLDIAKIYAKSAERAKKLWRRI